MSVIAHEGRTPWSETTNGGNAFTFEVPPSLTALCRFKRRFSPRSTSADTNMATWGKDRMMIIKIPPADCLEVYPDPRTPCLHHPSRTLAAAKATAAKIVAATRRAGVYDRKTLNTQPLGRIGLSASMGTHLCTSKSLEGFYDAKPTIISNMQILPTHPMINMSMEEVTMMLPSTHLTA